jgi:hypothetical protein
MYRVKDFFRFPNAPGIGLPPGHLHYAPVAAGYGAT